MRQLTEFFSLLINFAQQSAEASRFLIECSAPSVIVNYYLRRAQEEMVSFIFHPKRQLLKTGILIKFVTGSSLC